MKIGFGRRGGSILVTVWLVGMLAGHLGNPNRGLGAELGIEGRPAPRLGVDEWVQLPQGKKALEVDDFRGRVLYIYCFQSWCPGCHRHGFPTLVKLLERYGSDDQVAFLAIQTTFEGFSTNSAERALEVAGKYGLTIPVGHSDGGGQGSSMMRRYRSGGTPWTIIVDPEGVVRFNDFHLQPTRAIEVIESLKKS